jgi:hypothetical protein
MRRLSMKAHSVSSEVVSLVLFEAKSTVPRLKVHLALETSILLHIFELEMKKGGSSCGNDHDMKCENGRNYKLAWT